MNVPNFIDRRTLAKMAAPNETHCVRVILQKVSNSAPYTVRSRLRRYQFERDGIAGCHVLDIPVSVWMLGTPTSGPYRANPSISSDLQPTIQLPFTIQVIPWVAKGASTITTESQETASDAPESVAQADDPTAPEPAQSPSGDPKPAAQADDVASADDDQESDTPAPSVEESPTDARMRKMRDAKAAKKAQLTV